MKSFADIYGILTGTKLPVAYQAFPADDPPDLPFIVYAEAYSVNFAADGIVYEPGRHINVDLLTRDITAGADEVEAALTGAGLYWERTVEWLDDEKIFDITYEVEV